MDIYMQQQSVYFLSFVSKASFYVIAIETLFKKVILWVHFYFHQWGK